MIDSLPHDAPHDPEDDEIFDDLERDSLKIDDLKIDELEPDEDVDEFAGAYVSPPDDADAPVVAAEADLPAIDFFDAGPDSRALDELTLIGRPSVLDRLGPAHFRSKGFSFMGFLQTVYDHVAGELTAKPPATAADTPPADAPTDPSPDAPPDPTPDAPSPEAPPPADPQA